MRNAMLQPPHARTAGEHRQVLRAAVRQLERAGLYLAAVSCMALDDAPAERAVNSLSSSLEDLRRHLVDLPSER